jgi:hypothetical protein
MTAILENVALARILFFATCASLAVSVTVFVFARRFLVFPLMIAGLTVTHSFLWDSGLHGDCGHMLLGMAILWTAIGGACVLAQLALRIWLPPRRNVHGFPVVMVESENQHHE